MKPSNLVAALNMPDSTIRKYANEFSGYLSPAANPALNHHRDYSEQDARIIKLIADMKAAKQNTDSIHATLSSLQANDWERLPALDENSSAIISSPASVIAAQTDRAVMQNTIDMLREQLAAQEASATQQLEAERADRDQLLERLHRAETMLKLYEEGRLKPPGAST